MQDDCRTMNSQAHLWRGGSSSALVCASSTQINLPKAFVSRITYAERATGYRTYGTEINKGMQPAAKYVKLKANEGPQNDEEFRARYDRRSRAEHSPLSKKGATNITEAENIERVYSELVKCAIRQETISYLALSKEDRGCSARSIGGSVSLHCRFLHGEQFARPYVVAVGQS